MLVRAELEKLGIPFLSVDLGEVELREELSEEKKLLLGQALLKSGFPNHYKVCHSIKNSDIQIVFLRKVIC